MLPKLFPDIDRESDVCIRKFSGAEDASDMGAFSFGTCINFEVSVSRRLGASDIVMRLCRDGCPCTDIPLEFEGSDNVRDVYSLVLDTKELCGKEGYGLFYYEFLLLRGEHTLFTDTYNNLDFHLSEREGSKFRLLIYEKDFKTPESFGHGVMYHVFVDRFFKGECEEAKHIAVKPDAVLNEDWEHGIPQYAEKPGDPVSNNVFFGGNLWGVAEKLDYLKELGVTYIYLSPIFEAYSNHKYDTGDYMKIDPMFGGEEAFDNLVKRAKELGVGIILDGVFNHTGDDSIYFNRYKKYGEGGAYNDPESEYKDWFCFKKWPDEYESWWGIEILPKLDHSNDACREYFTGESGVIRKYIKKGIAGWRLDVADELSDEILDAIRTGAKEESRGEAVIIGEVWENAADKVAYGKRRRYFSGKQLDSVMNYPVRNAILDFCRYGDGNALYNTLTEIYSSYPRMVSDKLMNLLGTHDTERIITMLGGDLADLDGTNAELAERRLSTDKLSRGVKLLKIASALQYTVYGIPSLYYGDEVGLEGAHDPFCRMPFPWGELDKPYRSEILEHYRRLGRIRQEHKALHDGRFYVVRHTESSLVFVREREDDRVLIAVNRGDMFDMPLPEGKIYRELLTDTEYRGSVRIEKDRAMIFKEC